MTTISTLETAQLKLKAPSYEDLLAYVEFMQFKPAVFMGGHFHLRPYGACIAIIAMTLRNGSL